MPGGGRESAQAIQQQRLRQQRWQKQYDWIARMKITLRTVLAVRIVSAIVRKIKPLGIVFGYRLAKVY
jgi:hypothetical protein